MEYSTIADEKIISKIYMIRGFKIMLDKDLSELYGVETKQLKRQVKRNSKRFPEDFMFELTPEEFENLRCQFGTSSLGWGGTRYMPMAFTEQGVAMLSSVLNSDTAIDVNIQIIRIFTKVREMISGNTEVLLKIQQFENKLIQNLEKTTQHEEEIELIFKHLKQLLNPPEPEEKEKRGPLGFQPNTKK